jgi:ABC-type tungstate transport system permease subunit
VIMLVTTKLVKIFVVVVVNSDVITVNCRASQRLVEFFVVEKTVYVWTMKL